MIKFYLKRNLSFSKLKNSLKNIFILQKKLIKVTLFFPSLILIAFLKKNFQKKRKKLLGLRLTRKYFGHLAMESAMASAYQDINKDSKIITSFKPGKGIGNKYLNSIHCATFQVKKDFLLIFLNFFYYGSTCFVKRNIKKYYEPFIDKNNEREFKYIDYLETSSDFSWRKIGRKILFHKKSNSRNIIIAMRTSHFNEKKIGVSSQPWRNVSFSDIHTILQAANRLSGEEKVFCFTNKKVWQEINKMEKNLDKIYFIDENNTDILDLINEDSLMINNGNGIGAAIYSLGIKTLYLHHTVWHFWHSSHSNGFAYPCEFKKSQNQSKNNDLNKLIELAFLPKKMPYNFEKEFYSKGVTHNRISDLSIMQIQNSIIEAINVKPLKDRKSAQCLGVEFYYRNPKERYFWELYIKHQPKFFSKFRRKISLNIASEFLNSYI